MKSLSEDFDLPVRRAVVTNLTDLLQRRMQMIVAKTTLLIRYAEKLIKEQLLKLFAVARIFQQPIHQNNWAAQINGKWAAIMGCWVGMEEAAGSDLLRKECDAGRGWLRGRNFRSGAREEGSEAGAHRSKEAVRSWKLPRLAVNPKQHGVRGGEQYVRRYHMQGHVTVSDWPPKSSSKLFLYDLRWQNGRVVSGSCRGNTLNGNDFKLKVDIGEYCIDVEEFHPYDLIIAQYQLNLRTYAFKRLHLTSRVLLRTHIFPRTPKPLTFSKNRLRRAKNRSNTSPVAKTNFRKNKFFFFKNFCICAYFQFCLFEYVHISSFFFKTLKYLNGPKVGFLKEITNQKITENLRTQL
ncbi:hypothetical protein LXL04_037526 [Taraxacum kok-saghyz]